MTDYEYIINQMKKSHFSGWNDEESRTSSPVRIVRDDESLECFEGIYPCGEGAGYAGGIMSAAMDGIKVAEAIAGKFKEW